MLQPVVMTIKPMKAWRLGEIVVFRFQRVKDAFFYLVA